jgi:hypothetical protein
VLSDPGGLSFDHPRKYVPKLLSQEQQQLRLEVARDMLECANGDPEFLKSVITVKVLLTVFSDYCGIMHHSYAPEGQTINKEYYLEVIYHLHDAVWHKRPDLWASRNWQLHHDSARAHSSHLI